MIEHKIPPPLVDVIIPVYNYEKNVERAIDSVKKQTVTNLECYIINDGSTDNTEQVVLDAISDDARFHYKKIENSGVANARNTGVFLGRGQYVCCLDADDALAPKFLEACLLDLEKDRTISIAYTGLYYIKPNGDEGLSKWPDEYDYDAQLTGRNQLPTCNVARREVWERLGGQRQRYAPEGAGEEDAEMWLRCGAYGFRARKVTNAGLFIYSWLSGRVSGNKEHEMVDYRMYHPWVQDGKHPMMSLAKPVFYSHPVRAYDEPTVSIIIPVGDGHEEELANVLDSLEAQSMRKWEVIVVWDTKDDGGISKRLTTTYPYMRVIENESGENWGAGKARNKGAEIARAPLLLFVDADDWLYPNALSEMLAAWRRDEGIIYTHYVGKTYLSQEGVEDFKDRLLYFREDTGEAVVDYKSAVYDCERAIKQPTAKPYIWCLITALVPKAWHDEIGGFDEIMPSWEDWDYWVRMARAGKCFYLIDEALVVYRFYTGRRRTLGRHEHKKLLEYMKDKYAKEGIDDMACSSCSGRSKKSASINTRSIKPGSMDNKNAIEDDNVKLVILDDGHTGQHRIVGAHTKREYGYRASGEKFYIDERDYNIQKHIFKTIEDKVEVEKETPKPPPPPEPKEEKEEVAGGVLDDIMGGKKQEEKPKSAIAAEPFDFADINGVTDEHAAELNALGVHTIADVLDFGEEKLTELRGIGKARAKSIVRQAKAVLE